MEGLISIATAVAWMALLASSTLSSLVVSSFKLLEDAQDWASALYLAAYYDRLGVVDLLVEHGVALDPHVLHWAAEGDSKDVVEFLIQSGVNLDQVTDPF
ncbi:hypothetical protein NA56DRAFT_704533 [Hyaloscypha hepaticicola]|uniref:Uncharacterized protein n=1 Tax=Hyaloscypha hepaticicola TaxID=2082293 RepID=A0A2J6Q3B3_9HELO|nr:hypothetical protein NA56DRAFT_704533 [Hyaloscypha hepaticicola]